MNLVIGYGSQTGNAQEVAEYFYRECLFRDIPSVSIMSMDELSILELQSSMKIVVFVCSTTGDGEEPKNMQKFWKSLLKKSLSSDAFSGLSYAVLGLGDSSYAKFNYVAKRLFRRLQNLGGRPVHKLGLSDEQHPEGADYLSFTWIEELFKVLSSQFNVPFTRRFRVLPPKYTFTISSANVTSTETDIQDTALTNKDHNTQCCIVGNKRLTSTDHFQDVRLITLDVTDKKLSYKPGDVVWIYPENRPEDVDDAARLLNLNLDSILTFTSPSSLPTSLTIRRLLTSYLDISAVPARRFFEICATFPTDEMEREKFEEFTSLSGQDELFSYVNRPRRNTLEVLQDFTSVRNHLDIRYLFDIIPLIRPRGFSIASAQSFSPDTLDICVAIVRYKTNLKKERLGLCSNWLSKLPLLSPVKLYVETGSFVFPKDRPIIMVGPGTGCAPFRALIQDRIHMQQKLVLFFGSRNENADYFFRDEWTRQENLQVFTAFSRDQSHKVYVQHRIVEQGSLIWSLMMEGAVFCVAGNSKNMPFQVMDALLKVFETHGELSASEAKSYLDQLVKCGLYQTETW